MEPISKEEAIEQGLGYYYTGIMCRNGHYSDRSVKTGNCRICSRNCRKRSRIKNSEKENERSRRYRMRHKEKISKRYSRYRQRPEVMKRKNEISRQRGKNDARFQCMSRCRGMLNRTINESNIEKSSNTYDMIGYGHEELKNILKNI